MLLSRNALRAQWFSWCFTPFSTLARAARQLVTPGPAGRSCGTRIGQRLLGVLAPEPAVADAAESAADGDPDIVVDEDSSGLDLPAHPHDPIAVQGENRCDETELGVVGDPYRLVLVGERDQCDDRAEDLLVATRMSGVTSVSRVGGT